MFAINVVSDHAICGIYREEMLNFGAGTSFPMSEDTAEAMLFKLQVMQIGDTRGVDHHNVMQTKWLLPANVLD